MTGKKILIAEDEKKIRELLSLYLKKEGFNVYEAKNGREALERFDREVFDVLVLDVMMPEYDGWSVLKRVRKTSSLPVLMLTAREEEEDKLFGFELGVDDYVTKPFSVKEVVARVKALLKRGGESSREGSLTYRELTVDAREHEARIGKEKLPLTLKEFDLLTLFLENKNQALSREQILDRVWGFDYYGDLRTVDTHVKRLRRKMGELGDRITTVRGVGYRLEEEE
ncbi:response regulator transcription factor [Isachenkonia alkalipeptolytica]|uniref:Stage 0 sporulation protein A homolog n=1 Tax=Isachenkonia alkalipeptolytica TaxID=2565777 RepID=A0AA43XM12_9CLOT|nr:response regulator transcription factor [Isachenkonia alkalipeptolytica]